MRNINKTGLPGNFKAWIYQHGLLPPLTWPLMLYEIPTTAVEKLERTINKHLPISVTEEIKVIKAILIMTLKDSRDNKVQMTGVQVRTGRKWSASKAVEEAESRLITRIVWV